MGLVGRRGAYRVEGGARRAPRAGAPASELRRPRDKLKIESGGLGVERRAEGRGGDGAGVTNEVDASNWRGPCGALVTLALTMVPRSSRLTL